MSMFTKIGSVSKGKYKITRTTTTEITSDMEVAREFWRLVGDAPAGIARFVKNCPEVLDAVKVLAVALPKFLADMENVDPACEATKED